MWRHLDDRALRDIGLTRADAHAAALGLFDDRGSPRGQSLKRRRR
jgi:hypothetical protein